MIELIKQVSRRLRSFFLVPAKAIRHVEANAGRGPFKLAFVAHRGPNRIKHHSKASVPCESFTSGHSVAGSGKCLSAKALSRSTTTRRRRFITRSNADGSE